MLAISLYTLEVFLFQDGYCLYFRSTVHQSGKQDLQVSEF